MNVMITATLVAVVAQLGASRPYQSPPGELTRYATISSKQGRDIEIPATADGMLTQLPVREGDRIEAGQLLATIDDREAQAAVDVQQNALEAAMQRADDEIELQYAQASSKVAKVDVQKSEEANRKNPNSVSAIELMEKKLVVERSRLQIEKARKDQQLALLDANVKKAELHAAEVALSRRQIEAPFEAHVLELSAQQYEWVRAGDPIMRIANFDVLEVACYVPVSDYSPADVAGRRVTVRIQLPRGREASVEGRVVYVSQEIGGKDEFLVRADIGNQLQGGFWQIQPGLEAEMTIHVGEAAASKDLGAPSAR